LVDVFSVVLFKSFINLVPPCHTPFICSILYQKHASISPTLLIYRAFYWTSFCAMHQLFQWQIEP
jgi:hypothetical protein